MAVGAHDRRIADLEVHMHDLVLAAGRNAAGLRVRHFLVLHHHLVLGAEHLLVEGQGLFRPAVEKQIGLDLHDSLLSCGLVETLTCGARFPSRGTCRWTPWRLPGWRSRRARRAVGPRSRIRNRDAASGNAGSIPEPLRGSWSGSAC